MMRLGLLWFFVLLFGEIWSIIEMSDAVGGLATFVLLVGGLFFGLQLMRAQGISALLKASKTTSGSMLLPFAEGIVKAFAGVLLIIPGFISDIVALVILLPIVRTGFARYLAKKGQFKGFAAGGFGQGGFGGFGRPGSPETFSGGNVYDHDGNSKVDKAHERAIEGDVIEGEIIQPDSNQKPKDAP